jgi:hypothetical protein
MAVQIPDAANATQPGWRLCVRCLSLFYEANREGRNGWCPHPNPAGKGHQAMGWDFYLLADPENVLRESDPPAGS